MERYESDTDSKHGGSTMRIVSVAMALLLALSLAVLSACGGGEGDLTPTPTSVDMTLYENTEHGFSIEYPEGWIDKAQGAGTYFSAEFRDPEGLLAVDVSIEYKTEEIALADSVSESKAYMEDVPQFELISEGDVTIGEDAPGYEMVGEGDIGAGKVEKFRYVMLVRDKQVFWAGVKGEPAVFDQQEELVGTVVDSFRLLPTYTYVPPTPGPAGTYTSAEHGFSISYPAGWMEAPTSRAEEIVSLASVEGLPSVSVAVQPVEEGITLAGYALQLSQGLGQYWGDYELVSEGEITLDDGTPAYEIVFSGTGEGYALKCKYVVVIQGTQAFWVMGFSMPATFEEDEATLDEVIRSFHLE
jgi:hypothetical protein